MSRRSKVPTSNGLMKSKREILEIIESQYSGYMSVWTVSNLCGYITAELIPFDVAKEEHYLITNAANKFWHLIGV